MTGCSGRSTGPTPQDGGSLAITPGIRHDSPLLGLPSPAEFLEELTQYRQRPLVLWTVGRLLRFDDVFQRRDRDHDVADLNVTGSGREGRVVGAPGRIEREIEIPNPSYQ